MTFLSHTVQDLCQKHGIAVRRLPRSRGRMELSFADGRIRHVEPHRLDLNGTGATEMARVKPWSLHFLRSAGFRVPDFDFFFRASWAARHGTGRTEAEALAFARSLGFPVVVKPATQSYGRGVALVTDEAEFTATLPAVTAHDPMFMVQRFVAGQEYRVVVLDGKVELAYRKAPFTISGDGQRTIAALIADRLDTLRQHEAEVPVEPDDPSFDRMLGLIGHARGDVLPSGSPLVVGLTAGAQWGGYLQDELDTFPEGPGALATAIVKQAGLRVCGLDLMLEAGGDPGDAAAYHLIEINSSPSLDGYAKLGPVERERAIAFIERALLAMAHD